MAKKDQQESMTINDAQNLVIENKKYDASVIPKTKNEMWRRVSLSRKVHITGSVFSGSLEINEGPCTIDQSVFVRTDATVNLSKTGRSVIRGCIQVERSLVIESKGDSYLAVLGDVYTKTLNIRNCVIYGNVYCESGIIRDSVVVGSVISTRTLEVENTVIGTYLARTIKTSGKFRLLHPFGASENKPELENFPSFLLLGEDMVFENARTIAFMEKDLVFNPVERKDMDTILPNHMLGIGSRLMSVEAMTDRLVSTTNSIAGMIIGTTSLKPEDQENPDYEGLMMLLTSADLEELESTHYSLADYPISESNIIDFLGENSDMADSEETVPDKTIYSEEDEPIDTDDNQIIATVPEDLNDNDVEFVD